jgi:PAS domain S-box-containing protein
MLHGILNYQIDALAFAVLSFGGMLAVHVWLRRRRAAGVRPAAWGALLAVVAVGVVAAQRNGDAERRHLRNNLEGFAATYAQELERMGHARVGWDTPGDDPLYQSMIEAQVRWLRVNPIVADVYTYRRNADGQMAFVVDSETDYDGNGHFEGERESRTPVGEFYPQAGPAMAAVFAGTPAFEDNRQADRWGTWVSAFTPLRGADGKVEAGLGVDYDADDWASRILIERGVVLGAACVLAVILISSTATVTSHRAEVERRKVVERALILSELRARVVIDTTLDAVVSMDAAGRITGWNSQAQEIFGWTAGEVVGRLLNEAIVPERFRDEREQGIRQYVLTGRSPMLNTRIETSAVRKGGQEFPVELAITPVRAGDAVSFSAFIRDITKRNTAEQALRDSEERFRLAAQCASDNIYEWDVRTGRINWHGGIDERMGYKPGGFPRTLAAWEQAIHPDDRARVLEELARHFEVMETFRSEYRVVRADGAILHWTDCGMLIRDAAGEPKVMVGVVTDVSGQKHTQLLEGERSALKKAVASMEQVLGVVAHELRTPLAGVRAMTEYLLEAAPRDTVEFDQFLRSMNHEVVRMADTVNNLLEAARINSGRARWNWSTFDVAELCREAVSRAMPLVDPAAVTMSSSVQAAELNMNGDADAVSRLLLNLLSNAAKHTQRGTIRVTASLSEEAGRLWLDLEVSDTGEGIAPEILDRLGEAFALNSGIVGAKHVRGTGLGLAICAGIAAAHGGRVRFHSHVGEGTAARVRLRADLDGPVTSEAHAPTLAAA